ncbi:MAG: SDR family oxidoreductase [Solirubrobacteraceae bacterium]
MRDRVLVTGGSGFVGSHCILRLLEAGYSVRTTVRSADREAAVRALLATGGAPDAGLEFAVADLVSDAGWADAAQGCAYVLHVASPFPAGVPTHEDELIVPAREGALRVLRAARDARVRRVVLTSSFAAIGYGHRLDGPRTFSEDDWSDASGELSAYAKSKTLAERAAWEFVRGEGGGLELAVVNPTAVLGPVLGADYSTSIQLVQRLLDGAMPGVPKLRYGVVDVRDLADLHVRAMTDSAAAGERFIGVSGDFVTVHEIALALKQRMGATAARVPTRVLPNWLVRLAALRDPSLRQLVPELGKARNAAHDKATQLLGWAPRPPADAIAATGDSLVALGLVKPSS